ADAGPAPGEPAAELDEPHVGPTIWPLVYALSAIALVIGAVGNRWALVPGGVLFLAASIGWVRDVHRQWHHHVAIGHGESSEHGTGPQEAEPAGAAALPHQSTPPPDDGAAMSASGEGLAGDGAGSAG